jgi:ribonuclease Y
LSASKGHAKKILEEASKEAERLKKDKLVEAKEESLELRKKIEKELDDRKNEVQRLERRILGREENLERRYDTLESREKILTTKEEENTRIRKELSDNISKINTELERISGMTQDEAKKFLLQEVEKNLEHEVALKIKKSEEKYKDESDVLARRIISTAIQKYASEQVVESTVSVVDLPSDEMKGRIIGREGRNIRMLENLTGINLIIDDTPEAVILSGFDPVRREIARMALEKLVVDGRIHPARIEESVEKAQKEMDVRIWKKGEQTAFELNITGLHNEIIKLLGRLQFRTSYGQNVLQHSIEVAHLASVIASELGLDPTLSKRAGLLHDIGKAIDMEQEGPHALLGAKFAERYGENSAIVHAIAAHHEDEEIATIEAAIVQACDAISAARPGARRESLEMYLKRLEKLENTANSFDGVEKSYAIQAGREIRIMVKPEKVDDLMAGKLAHDIVKKIEEELEYPGQIKVVVIRESRTIEFAK